MSALADRHLGEAFVRLRLRLGQLPPEYLRLPALIHEGLTQQMPDYAAAVWRLEGLLGRELSGALDEAPAWRHTPRWGCREKWKKPRVYHKIFPVKALRWPQPRRSASMRFRICF